MRKMLAALCGVLALAGSSPVLAAGIRGEYVEARTSDVFTGPCFSNAEVFITGHQAIVAWKVREGSYKGVDLSGLTVAAAIRGTSTFSEDQPEKAKTILIVDKNASARQHEALIALAKELGGDRLKNVVEVKTSLVSMMVESHPATSSALAETETAHDPHGMPQAPKARFWAPGLAEILTRPLNEGDHACGNEVIAYEPLSKGTKVLPAFTLYHISRVKGLGTTWNDPNARSSFVGSFEL